MVVKDAPGLMAKAVALEGEDIAIESMEPSSAAAEGASHQSSLQYAAFLFHPLAMRAGLWYYTNRRQK